MFHLTKILDTRAGITDCVVSFEVKMNFLMIFLFFFFLRTHVYDNIL